MENRKELPEMIQLFKEEFNDDLSVMNTLVEYEVLILQIGMVIDDNPNDAILGEKIRIMINNWRDKNKDIQKAPKKVKKEKESSYPKIELLNSEGPILWLKRTPEGFLMYDEWKYLVGKFNVDSLISFIQGTSTVTDSKNRVWNYLDSNNDGMRVDPIKLQEFINVLR